MGLYDSCWLPEYEESQLSGFNENVTVLGDTHIIRTVKEELLHYHSFFIKNRNLWENKKILFGRAVDLPPSLNSLKNTIDKDLNEEGYIIQEENGVLSIIGKEDKGVLYGMFHFLRLLQMKKSIEGIHITENPHNRVRMINHWDNMDDSDFMGSVERGYAGRSIFYENNKFVEDKSRLVEYARLLASVGINSISINNVNVHQLESKLITAEFLPDVAKVADIFRGYGITLFLSVNYASPMELGGLPNADPLDEQVKAWWKAKVAEIYEYIPDFGGFVVKADSEGRPGPFTYQRNHADGANLLGEALQPFGGIVFWRCFVYNCLQDWRDRKTDRARAAYDHFKPLDGEFLDNVILQVKSGPMDFQVREPVSPLFGAMEQTNQAMEFQITQEYTGQQKHICFLVPQWKEVLNFETYAQESRSMVRDIVNGSLYERPYGGIVAVSNIGSDYNWTGHKLAQANFYGYGRLIWNTSMEVEEIANEWITLTFGQEKKVVENIKHILMNSWSTYEKYTAPLGVGWMVEPGHHYGPNIDGYEYSRWGTYHFADCHGIGVDRTIATGTGYAGQYFQVNQERYENLETCPDELLLFFHHVPYTHILHSGKTVIQHIYDVHFEGVQAVEDFIEKWNEIEGKIADSSFQHVRNRLEEQLRSAREWRDQINTYFYRKSGMRDTKGRMIYQ